MDVDGAAHAVGERQHGAVAVRQLRELGAGRQLRQRRVASGRWELATPRVVRLAGTPRTPHQLLMIAVLDAGCEAIASHEAAAWLWCLPGFAATDVVVRDRHRHAAPSSAVIHRPTLVLPHHRTVVSDIPCTTLPRTLFDLAGTDIAFGRLERLVDAVITKSPAMLVALHEMLHEIARRGRPGIAAMRALLADRPVGTRVPASGLEARFERILADAGEPPFDRQVDVGGASWLGRVDYVDASIRLLVEIDSVLHHTSISDRRRDAARDAALLAAGYRKVLRITEEDVWQRPWRAIEAVREARRALRTSAA